MSEDLRIMRWEIPVDDQDHEVAAWGEVVGAEVAMNSPWLMSFWTVETEQDAMAWIERNESSGRRFRVFGTGQSIPGKWEHRASAPRTRGLVFHLMERQR